MEVTDFKSEVEIDLRGCLEAAMASEATKMAVRCNRCNMHMDTRVIEDADFKSELKFDLRGLLDTRRPPKWQLEAICTWIPR